jgi:transcriptional regulator with XRE-family HTH domain
MNINDRIKQSRIEKGLKQGEVAEKLGMSNATLSSIELGKNKPTITQLEAISSLFNVSADYLLTGEDLKVSPVERDILRLVREDSGLYKSLMEMLSAKKSVINRSLAA